MKNIISAEEASRLIGCSPQTVRERLKRGMWSFGRAYSPKLTGLTQWVYEVYVDQLETYLRGENNGNNGENL